MSIPVRNFYYLLCYAWRELDERGLAERGDAGEFQRTGDLFGTVLARGVMRLTRRGLDRDYRARTERVQGIRGRIDFAATLRTQALLHGRTVCEVDDLSPDVLKNRILATTLDLLLASELRSDVRDAVHLARDRMGRITPVALSEGVFTRVRLGQDRRQYRFLLEVARLLYRTRLVDEGRGASTFREISLGDLKEWQLFERFAHRFFELEQRAFQVRAQTRLAWAGLAGPGADAVQGMHPDLVLESPTRRIVLDTKYYTRPLTERYGVEKVRAGNLYQLFAYVTNLQATHPDGPRWEGVLL
ncbi:MAG: hypothetical protein RQ745_13670, partial [Longimicrobiales bacterium]|nr:hypothetical protein [Longimicrobiales bacterium]